MSRVVFVFSVVSNHIILQVLQLLKAVALCVGMFGQLVSQRNVIQMKRLCLHLRQRYVSALEIVQHLALFAWFFLLLLMRSCCWCKLEPEMNYIW